METCTYTIVSAPPDAAAFLLVIGMVWGAVTYCASEWFVRRFP